MPCTHTYLITRNAVSVASVEYSGSSAKILCSDNCKHAHTHCQPSQKRLVKVQAIVATKWVGCPFQNQIRPVCHSLFPHQDSLPFVLTSKPTVSGTRFSSLLCCYATGCCGQNPAKRMHHLFQWENWIYSCLSQWARFHSVRYKNAYFWMDHALYIYLPWQNWDMPQI